MVRDNTVDQIRNEYMERLGSKTKVKGDWCELESDVLASAFKTPETFYKLYDRNIFVFDTNTVTTCTDNKESTENVLYQEGVETISSNGTMTC